MNIYKHITESKKNGKKLFSILIDPDKQGKQELISICHKAAAAKSDFFFVGGSLLTNDSLDNCISTLKENSDIPIIWFPGNAMQVNNKADGILFLSLISGRNAEMLIGKQVITAPILKQASLLATGSRRILNLNEDKGNINNNKRPLLAEDDNREFVETTIRRPSSSNLSMKKQKVNDENINISTKDENKEKEEHTDTDTKTKSKPIEK